MKCNVYAYDLVLINNNVRSGDFSVDRKNQLISPVTGVYVVFQHVGKNVDVHEARYQICKMCVPWIRDLDPRVKRKWPYSKKK